jgi:hypothetical protein
LIKWREDQAHTSLLATISSCLSFVFVAEVSMKMIAFTPHGYWQSRRNRYDTLVTVMGLVWAITNYTMGVITLSNLHILCILDTSVSSLAE